jgi:hypothetical protein
MLMLMLIMWTVQTSSKYVALYKQTFANGTRASRLFRGNETHIVPWVYAEGARPVVLCEAPLFMSFGGRVVCGKFTPGLKYFWLIDAQTGSDLVKLEELGDSVVSSVIADDGVAVAAVPHGSVRNQVLLLVVGKSTAVLLTLEVAINQSMRFVAAEPVTGRTPVSVVMSEVGSPIVVHVDPSGNYAFRRPLGSLVVETRDFDLLGPMRWSYDHSGFLMKLRHGGFLVWKRDDDCSLTASPVGSSGNGAPPSKGPAPFASNRVHFFPGTLFPRHDRACDGRGRCDDCRFFRRAGAAL